MSPTTFTAGLSAVANAVDVDTVDQVRRTVDGHGSAGRLTADAVAALAAACKVRVGELLGSETVGPVAAPVVMTLAASAPAPTAATGSVPDGDYTGTITQAGEREWPDSGVVLSVVVAVEVSGEVVDVRARFDAGREIPRKACFRSAGLPSGSDPSMLVGRPVRVTLSTWSPPSGGSARPVVRRWLAPAGAAPKAAAPAAPKAKRSAKPDWETGDDVLF